VEISGSAPFVGLVMYPAGGDPAEGFFVGRYFGSVLADEGSYTVWPLANNTLPPDGPIDLPAGQYWLQLIASGDAEVTIHFEGLEGSTELTPDTPTSTHIVPLSPRSPGGQGNVFWAGTRRTLDRPGFALVAQAMTFSSPETDGVWGDCLYRGEPPPEDVAYLPGCPGQDPNRDDSQFVAISHGGKWQRYQIIHRELQSGPYGLGIWNEAVTLVEDSVALGVWVSLAGS
jgi:hypothetical protein